jgi:hypothetical protein
MVACSASALAGRVAVTTWVNLVGRDGIEPPTLRFSVGGPGVQEGAEPVTVLVSWHVA